MTLTPRGSKGSRLSERETRVRLEILPLWWNLTIKCLLNRTLWHMRERLHTRHDEGFLTGSYLMFIDHSLTGSSGGFIGEMYFTGLSDDLAPKPGWCKNILTTVSEFWHCFHDQPSSPGRQVSETDIDLNYDSVYSAVVGVQVCSE